MVVVPAQTGFEGNGNARRADDGFKYGGHQRFVLHQRAARLDVADFFGGAAHIDVDKLRAEGDVVYGRFRHLPRVAARNLHRRHSFFAAEIAAVQGFGGVSERGVAVQHFADRPACAERAAQSTERLVGNARHRRERDGGVDCVCADLHESSAAGKRMEIVQFLSRFSNAFYTAVRHFFSAPAKKQAV